ncbi:30S ribosome-binding factor RbfA [Pelagicoccus sp. SDUM812003]|uniref:30S ribosome-binding factor RbfA n=1 Tax=Pelagicoccus sp. SDUM812003 TaxID=3041267 RepID=UPI00280FE9CC|nr:30S ribosome-binding factor RbfA [Pelagicoccus sp. SDUM812003]MDQ8204973.1 30S ribosome-binding factor RbfA [Pelagicoccus sp. SDUM812003]
MSNRKIRVGELMKREISDILHTRFKGSAVMITITEVDVSPDNKNAKVLFSVIETKDSSVGKAQRFLDAKKSQFKRELSRRIVLKYMPELEFVFDEKNLAANRVNEMIDGLEFSDDDPEESDSSER